MRGMCKGPVAETRPSSWTKWPGPLALNVHFVDVCSTSTSLEGSKDEQEAVWGLLGIPALQWKNLR